MTSLFWIPRLLRENREQILNSWMDAFKAENEDSFELICAEKIYADSRTLLNELSSSIESENYSDIKAPEYNKLLTILESISSYMAEKRFIFTGTNSYIVTLKRAAVEIIQESSPKMGDISLGIESFSNFMDKLLYAFMFFFIIYFDRHPDTVDSDIIGYGKKLKSLQFHAYKLNRAETIQEVADNTYDAMVTTLGHSVSYLVLIEDDHRRMCWVRGIPYPGVSDLRPFSENSVLGRVVKTKKPYLNNDLRDDPHYIPPKTPLWADLDWFSLLSVPVIIDDNVIAVLNAESTRLNAFSEQDQQLVETLASHITSAINRIGLLEEKERYEEKLEALHQHAKQLSDATSIEEVATHTIDVMVTTLGFRWGSFCLVEGNSLKLIETYGYALSDDVVELDLNGPGITVRTFHSGETQLIRDTRRDEDFIEVVDLERSTGSLSELDVPVKIGDIVVAVLNAESDVVDAFTEQDKTLLETLALHVGSAISRLNRADEVRQLAYRLNSLELGGCYLSDSHERCLKAYAILSMQDVPGLCILREDPQMIVKNYGINAEEIVLLSSRPFKGFKALQDLQSVSLAISRFLESGRGIVLFDGLEYLITRFGFDTVYSFLQEKRFDFLESEAVLLVPLDMETLDSREKALLSSEFNLLE